MSKKAVLTVEPTHSFQQNLPDSKLVSLAEGEVIVGQAAGTDAANKAISGDATLAATGALTVGAGAITQAKIAANALDGTVAKNVADANMIGGIPVLHRIDVADAASGDVDVVLTHKTRVVDAWAVKTGGVGGAANTVQVKNGATAITDAIDLNVADQTVKHATTIDDASHEIAAGGTLRCSRVKAGGNAACIVYVLGIRVA